MPGHEKRVLSLDGLRGLGALIVFLYHVDIMVKPFGAGGPSLFPGGASVMVFFILSGIVLSLVPFKHMGNGGYDWLGYYPRRVVRLCGPLFAAIALALPAGYVAWRLGSTSRSALAVAYDAGLPTAVHDILMQFDVLFNVSDGVNNLFGAQLVRVDSPVWSMSWELWFSLTLPLAIWCISRIRRTGLAVVATFIAVLVSHWTGYFPLRLCLMFWLGVMVARQFDKIKAVKLSMLAELALLVASVGVIELSLVWHPGGVLEALESTAMNAACLVVVVVAIADGFTRRALSAAPMVFLGKVSVQPLPYPRHCHRCARCPAAQARDCRPARDCRGLAARKHARLRCVLAHNRGSQHEPVALAGVVRPQGRRSIMRRTWLRLERAGHE